MSHTNTEASLFQDAKQVFQLFRPYFGFDAKNRRRTAAIFVILSGCLTSAVTMVYIQNAFSALNLLILTPGITLSAFSWGIAACLIPVISYATILSACALATSWLSENLYHELSQNLISKWIDARAFYGIKFIHSKESKINPAVVLGDDLNEICTSSTMLASSFTQALLDFVVGRYQLWILSVPLILTFSSMTIAIPAYMLIASVGYAAVYGLIVHFIDKNLRSIDKKLKQKKDIFNVKLHHVEEHAETIAMKMGNQAEKKNIMRKLDKVSVISGNKRWISFLLSFMQSISMNVSYMFGLALSAPGVIAGTLDPSNAFSVAQYFTSITNFFAWRKNNTISISSLTVSLERFNAFRNLMVQWDNIQAVKKLTTRKSRDHFSVKNLTISTPEEKTLLKNSTFTIPKGKATVIQGPSGIGKTTLFRCLADLWPYVEGELILPTSKTKDAVKIHYIPQQPYLPCRSRLIDVINYPNDEKLTTQKRAKIIRLMKKLGFNQTTINCLDKKDEWGKTLSGGEKQRIAIVSAIIKNPDILFIDEGTNGLDPKTKRLAESTLKQHLKGKTIIAIDHHAEQNMAPLTPFYDYALIMNKSNKKATQARIKCVVPAI